MQIIQVSRNRTYFPTKDWKHKTPEELGMDNDMLTDAIKHIENYFNRYTSFVVVKNGYIGLESYNSNPYEEFSSRILKTSLWSLTKIFGKPSDTFKDKYSDAHNLRSVVKSILSILLGIALDKGYIRSIEDKVFDYLPDEYLRYADANKSEIRINHLITMKSGLPSIERGVNAFKMMFCNGDWIKFILQLPMECKPGEKFDYNSANTHLLSAVISHAAKMSTIDFAQKYLFEPLGITMVHWEKDAKGHNFGGGNMFMNPYDVAKIGYLYLNNGIWDGNIIVSKEWIEKSLVSYYEWIYGFHYGYLWYLKNEKSEADGAEYMTYSAAGVGGQRIFVIPKLDIVAVATSRASLIKDPSYILNDVIAKFIIPACIR